MIKFTKKFSFAHGGIRIETFMPGQIVEEPSERLREVALKEKVAVKATEKDIKAFNAAKAKSDTEKEESK